MESVKRYSVAGKSAMYETTDGEWVAAMDFDRVTAEREALQLLLNNRDDLDDQLTSLEQRRYAEQQAREAAEKNADRYRWLLGNADIMHWENMLRCADLEGVESINQFIDAAINHAAEAGSQVAKQAFSMENQRIHPARFKCLACGDYHDGSGNLPCPKMSPTSGVKP